MIDDPFRSRLPTFVGPILRLYKILNLSPNQITFIALLLGAVSSLLVSQHFFISDAFVCQSPFKWR